MSLRASFRLSGVIAAGLLAVHPTPAVAAGTRSINRLPHASVTGFRGLGGIARIGDVNGDHRPDLAIGDYNTVHVLFAPRSGWHGTIDVRSRGRGFDIRGAAGSDAGDLVVGAGDFNGDGLRDVVVASLFTYPDEFGGSVNTAQSPRLNIVFGKRDTRAVDLVRPGRHARLILLRGRLSARGVRGTGDVNGDGYDDLIVGQQDDAHPGAQVVFGGRARTSLDLSRRWPGFRILVPGGARAASGDVDAAGDQNGDGLADVVVGGAPGEPAYVVFGRRSHQTVH